MNISEYIRSQSSSTSTKEKIAVIGKSTYSSNPLQLVQTEKMDLNNTNIHFPSAVSTSSNSNKMNSAKLSLNNRRSRKPAMNQFPGKLHDLMEFAEKAGLRHVIFWTLDNKAICVQNTYLLMKLLPQFFSQTKYRSFERQLNMWSFERTLDRLTNTITYSHPYFVKGQKILCRFLTRENFRTAAATMAQNEKTNNNDGSLSPTKAISLSQQENEMSSSGSTGSLMTLENIFSSDNLFSTMENPEETNFSNADFVCTIKQAVDIQLSDSLLLQQMEKEQKNPTRLLSPTVAERSHQRIVQEVIPQQDDEDVDIIDSNILEEILICGSTMNNHGELETFEGRQFFLVDDDNDCV